MKCLPCLVTLALTATACGNPGGDTGNEGEVITTITLTFSKPGSPDKIVEWDDPDGDGGIAPMIGVVDLTVGTYTLAVGFENRLESPPEIITDEVRDEGDDHQVFFTADALLAITTTDQDSHGQPIGLTSTVVATEGLGMLTVTLRHMPPLNGTRVKDGTTMAGMVDATATFNASVVP
jgi:hypothetical protein